MNNIILMTDSYKISHWKQYPPNTEYVYSYFESRGCVVKEWSEVTFFGLQYFLKEYMVGQVVSREKIEEAFDVCQHHFGGEFIAPGLTNPGNFFRDGWEYILSKHGGRLPVKIKAVPEGMSVPLKTVLMTVENTDPKCYWLTNYLETLLVQVWYPMTVCSQSREQKKSIIEWYKKTGCDLGKAPGGVCFSLNDFGFRGVSSVESAMTGGAAHLVNFIGSDNMQAMMFCKRYYAANAGSIFECPAFSIPASEHSTITSWGKDREKDAMKNMLESYPDGLVACVSDSFDIFNACENIWGTELKSMIENRPAATGGRLVVRPDSGVPEEIVLKVLQILIKKFGSTKTPTGHDLLPPYIRVIQGDGVDYETIPKILKILSHHKIAADNVCFGSGGALLQKVHRDTFKCAFKCSEITIAGKSSAVFKDPITDPGKISKKGRLTLQKVSDTPIPSSDEYVSSKDSKIPGGKGAYHKYGDYVTVSEGKGDAKKDILVDVFANGELLKDWTFDEVRLKADLVGGPFLAAKGM